MSDLDDPEDAYDVGDPVPVRLVNFARRLAWLLDRLDLDPATVAARLSRLRDDLETMRGELAD